MDTKSKKWKAVASFLAFFLGVNLLLANLGPAFVYLADFDYYNTYRKDAVQTDYQNTSRFRGQISGVLEDFLCMAAGGPVGSGYWNSYDNATLAQGGNTVVYDKYSANSDWYYGDSATPTEVIENWEERLKDLESALQDLDEALKEPDLPEENRQELEENRQEIQEEIDLGPYGDGSKPKTQEELKKEYEKQGQKIHERYKEDLNILYSLAYNGKEKYTNTDGVKLDPTGKSMPEGYNFLLHFDGSKVTIFKDGQEVNVYGDGYFVDGESEWYVPGYQNFKVDDQTKNVTVTMAVAKTPRIYVKGNYSSSYAEQQNNRLYWIQKNMQSAREEVRAAVITAGAGVVLLLIYILLRKHKKRADQWLARGTGKIWFEFKFLPVLLVALGCVGMFLYNNREMFYWMLRGDGYDVQEVLSMAFSNDWGTFLGLNLVVFPVFWLFYFGVNDLRYNEKIWRHSLIGAVVHICRTSDLERPIQRRMVRLTGILFAVGTVLALPLPVLAILWTVNQRNGGNNSWVYILPIAFVLSLLAVGWIAGMYGLLKRIRETAVDTGRVVDQITAIRRGELKAPLEVPQDADLYEAARNLNSIQQGLDVAMEERFKSERMKVELVANVSHDIKTPLTAIISYVELLNCEPDLPEHVKEYIRVLDSKAQRLKTMIQDVFEVSKATAGQLPMVMETLDFGKLLRQTMADMAERIDASPVTVRAEIPEAPVYIMADGQRLYRVFQNLLQNALKYSLEGSRVYLTLNVSGRAAVASVKNTSKSELEAGVDFTERFLRGDESRTDGGSGLGLSIASSFTEACGGRFRVENIADLFVVTVEFIQVQPSEQPVI